VNCAINESSVFSKPEIKALLNQYVLVQLYTDSVPNEYQPAPSGPENLKFLHERFHTAQLPYYVILEPLPQGGFREVAHYDEGKINNVAAFADFLRKPLEANGAAAGAQVGAK
jgi:hypothetical protein